MTRKSSTIPHFFIIIGLLLASVPSLSQDTDTSQKKQPPEDFVGRMQQFAKESAIKSTAEFEADKAGITQNRILEEIRKVMQSAKVFLRTGLDTVHFRRQVAETERNFKTAGDGVLTNKGSAQTFRNLTTTSRILVQLLDNANVRKSRLDGYQHALTTYRYQLDSLSSTPDLFKFPADSVTLVKYIRQLGLVAMEIHPVDSALKQANAHLSDLQTLAGTQVLSLQLALDEVESHRRKMSGASFQREFSGLGDQAAHHRPLNEIIAQARAKGRLAMTFYIQNNGGKLLVMLLLAAASFIYLFSLKNIYAERGLLGKDLEGQLLLRYPLASAILIVINIFQFLFFAPTFAFSLILWTISCACLTLLFRGFITPYWMKVWLTMVGLFLVASIDNLLLQASRQERWFMLGLSLTGACAGVVVLLRGRRHELREQLILVSIGLMALIELAAAIANLSGRYNLAKSLMVSGYINVVIAILFLWTVRLINEGLYLSFNVYTRQERKLFYLNFRKVGSRAPLLFLLFLVAGWAILFGRNFAGFDYLVEPLGGFFKATRTIGKYSFSISSLLLFFVIMGIAMIVSRVVSFFASDRRPEQENQGASGWHLLGSWLLLVRIMILSIGLFLAIAASGIPVDRITIVIGALGVGIGFGLQTLVNNLISGLILAFEKPVNVGDIVEVDGSGGTMKSIGFRSSVITTWDGADVIMPNGYLLNARLTNWSLGGSHRRMSLVVGVDYEADLEKARQLVITVLLSEELVAKYPAPAAQYEHFSTTAIDLRVYFWTRNLKEEGKVTNAVICAIRKVFAENNIPIPYHR